MSFKNAFFLLISSPILSGLPWFFYKKDNRKILIYISSLILSLLPFVFQVLLIKNFSSSFIVSDGLARISVANVLEFVDISFFFFNESFLFGSLITFLFPLSLMYSFGYFNYKNAIRPYFFVTLSFVISITLCVAYSANMLTSFVFYEILTFTTYFLVTHDKTKACLDAGRTYVGFLCLPSVLFLFLVCLVYRYCGSVDYVENGLLRSFNVSKNNSLLIIILAFFGISKAAIFPFHKWLPTCMIAPTPVSAILHAVAVVKSGVFIILMILTKILNISMIKDTFSSNHSISVYIIGFSIIYSAIQANFAVNIKKRLAFSTISNISYIILAILSVSSFSTKAAFLFMFSHAFAKISMFFIAGLFYIKYKTESINQLNGMIFKEPFLMLCFSICGFCIVGFPPSLGFYAKYYAMLGSLQSGNFLNIVIFSVATILSFMYVLKMLYKAVFLKSEDKTKHYNLGLIVNCFIPIGICTFIGFFGLFYISYFIKIFKL